MLKSMTAYGRHSVVTEFGRFTVEIQSLNRKHLEINIFLPRDFSRFETYVRNLIGQHIHRGQVNVKVTIAITKDAAVTVTPNLPLLKQYKSAWDILQKELSLTSDDSAFFSLLSKESGIFLNEENLTHEIDIEAGLKVAVEKALGELTEMKLHEGKTLQQDFERRLDFLRTSIKTIAARVPGSTQKYRQKLLERIQEVAESSELDDRLIKEVAIYAEKVDVTEEIVRFQSHLDQLDKIIRSETESVGKTLEFLIQELHREINTVASKSSDVEISKIVIDCKSELEKMREQVQNIE